jgi:hypothetical protein
LTVVFGFFLIGIIDNVLVFYSILIFYEGNILDHISAKNNFTWCCLKVCLISASDSHLTIHVIEGSHQKDYVFVALDFDDYLHFLSQYI